MSWVSPVKEMTGMTHRCWTEVDEGLKDAAIYSDTGVPSLDFLLAND